jgi:hypothetical protein
MQSAQRLVGRTFHLSPVQAGLFLACALGVPNAWLRAEESASPAGIIELVPQQLPAETWQFVSGKKDAKLVDTWSISTDQETALPMLVCRGTPYGYLRTSRTYRDFELGLEWRFPADANGNSGILIYTSGEDRIWPTAIQIQLHQPEAGCIFASGAAKSRNELRQVRHLSRPARQWNECLVRSQSGVISVTINGSRVGEVTECRPAEGAIALQSEGAEIHFRRIWLHELPSSPPQEISIRPAGDEVPASNPEPQSIHLRHPNDGKEDRGVLMKQKRPWVTRPVTRGLVEKRG